MSLWVLDQTRPDNILDSVASASACLSSLWDGLTLLPLSTLSHSSHICISIVSSTLQWLYPNQPTSSVSSPHPGYAEVLGAVVAHSPLALA